MKPLSPFISASINKLKMVCAFILTLSVLVLTGCHSGVLAPKGAIAASELKLILFSIYLMLIVVVPVIFMAFFFAWRYRASAKATYRPEWTHSVLLETIWWTIPCIIILILALVTWHTTHSLDPYKPLTSDKKPVTIEVVSLNWKWLFIYPEYNIATVNYIEIPTDRPINFKVTSAAPMNSFIVPQLGGQIYAMTGMETKLHLIANEPGIYDGFSANYTGIGFAEMQFKVKATSDAAFTAWTRTVQQSPNGLTWNLFWGDLVKPSIADPVTYFGRVDTGLFNDIVMSYMMPNYKAKAQASASTSNQHMAMNQELTQVG